MYDGISLISISDVLHDPVDGQLHPVPRVRPHEPRHDGQPPGHDVVRGRGGLRRVVDRRRR